MTKPSQRKRIIFDVTLEEHYEIKKRAAALNIPIRIYVLQAVERRIKQERKYDDDDGIRSGHDE
jgi:hypothetical protein